MIITLHNEQDSIEFAHNFSKTLTAGTIVTFSGDLGSGKTFICREVIKSLCGPDTKVTSPTFNLLQTYQAPNFVIYHFDLYRLKSRDEIYELGIEDAWNNNLCLIEWSEIIASLLPENHIQIKLKVISNIERSLELINH